MMRSSENSSSPIRVIFRSMICSCFLNVMGLKLSIYWFMPCYAAATNDPQTLRGLHDKYLFLPHTTCLSKVSVPLLYVILTLGPQVKE